MRARLPQPVYRPVYVAPPVYVVPQPVYVVQPYYRHDRGTHRGWAKKGYAPYGAVTARTADRYYGGSGYYDAPRYVRSDYRAALIETIVVSSPGS